MHCVSYTEVLSHPTLYILGHQVSLQSIMFMLCHIYSRISRYWTPVFMFARHGIQSLNFHPRDICSLYWISILRMPSLMMIHTMRFARHNGSDFWHSIGLINSCMFSCQCFWMPCYWVLVVMVHDDIMWQFQLCACMTNALVFCLIHRLAAKMHLYFFMNTQILVHVAIYSTSSGCVLVF